MNKSKIIMREKTFKEKLGKFRLDEPEKNAAVVEAYLNEDKDYVKKCVEDMDFGCVSDMMAAFQNAIKFEDEKERGLGKENEKLQEENKMKEQSIAKLEKDVKFLRMESSRLKSQILQLRELHIERAKSTPTNQNSLPVLKKDLSSKLPDQNLPRTSDPLTSKVFQNVEIFGECCEVKEAQPKINMKTKSSSLKKQRSVSIKNLDDIPGTDSFIHRPINKKTSQPLPESQIFESICISRPIQKLQSEAKEIKTRERANSQKNEKEKEAITNFKYRQHYEVNTKQSNLKEAMLHKGVSMPNHQEDTMLDIDGNLESKIEYNPEHSKALHTIARKNNLARGYLLKKASNT